MSTSGTVYRVLPRAIPDEAILLADFIDGASDGIYTYWSPAYLGKGTEGFTFVAERHHADVASDSRDDAVVHARFDYVTIKMSDMGEVLLHRQCARRCALGNLPFFGDVPYVQPLRSRSHVQAKLPPGFPPFAMITPLRLDGSGGPAPAVLEELTGLGLAARTQAARTQASEAPTPGCLDKQVIRGVYTHRELANWIELARSLTQALWTLHSQGQAHRDVKPGNIVLRSVRGWWCDISLIDFGLLQRDEFLMPDEARLGTQAYVHPSCELLGPDDLWYPSQNDVYALGITLAEVLCGIPAQLGPPAAKAGQPATIGGGLHHSLLLTEARAQVSAGRAHGRLEALELVLTRLVDAPLLPKVERASVPVLQAFLGEIEHLRGATRARTMGYPPQGLTVNNDRAPPSEYRFSAPVLAPQLASLRQFGSDLERRVWCEEYVDVNVPVGPNTYDHAVALLRSGRGRAAKVVLQNLLLANLAQPDPLREVVGALRLYAGVLCLRDRDFANALDLLSHYSDKYKRHPCSQEQKHDVMLLRKREQWWVEMLGLRLRFHQDHTDAYAETRSFIESPIAVVVADDPRARIWFTALRAHFWLYHRDKRNRVLFASQQISEVVEMTSAKVSGYEECYIELLLARIYSTPADWGRALPTLLTAAGRADIRHFPHEHAAALAIAASVVRRAFEGWESREKSLGRDLHRNGADPDECLYWAAECAFEAAEIYDKLAVPDMSERALVMAAKCLGLCDAPEYKVLAIQWLGFARNRSILAGAPNEYLELIHKMVTSWQEAARRILNLTEAEDPGSFLSRGFYNRFGEGLDRVLRPRATTRSGGHVEPTITDLLFQWAAVDLATPHRIFDWGCGTGHDAFHLAGLGHRVVGVDASAWAISAAEAESRRRPPMPVSFYRADLTRGDWVAPEWGQFDVVICRDSLYRVMRRTRLLERLRDQIVPGGDLLVTDLVQRGACAPAEYGSLCDLLGVAGLETSQQYQRRLDERAGWTGYVAHDMTEAFVAFLDRRLAQVNQSGLDERLQGRAMTMLSTLRNACDQGTLGWIFVRARRVT